MENLLSLLREVNFLLLNVSVQEEINLGKGNIKILINVDITPNGRFELNSK